MNDEYILGIDTSNYTTSVALLEKSGRIKEKRRLLKVKKGHRGLRQSEAFFQHMEVLPKLISELMENTAGKVVGVSVSTKPRPIEGSYMPVFKAGHGVGKSIAEVMDIPCFEFSHQEGHIEAIRPKNMKNFKCFHLSGGTCEFLSVENKKITIIGGSKDISFGQVIDRVGVALGFDFPAGIELDNIANENKPGNILKPIKIESGWINLSGIESQCQRAIKKGIDERKLISELFFKIANAIENLVGKDKTILVGGVATSKTIQKYLSENKNIIMPCGDLGRDNAVGIAILGGEQLWQ